MARVNVARWRRDPVGVLDEIAALPWSQRSLIVRSSAASEGLPGASLAGRHMSIPNVGGRAGLSDAICKVIASYSSDNPTDEVMVQPMCAGVIASGAASSCDPTTGSAYRIVSWCDGSSTDAVTGGGADVRTRICTTLDCQNVDHTVAGPVLKLIEEIEGSAGLSAFTIEFAVCDDGALVLFQLSELAAGEGLAATALISSVTELADAATSWSNRDARILGEGVLLAAMTDWNPAELIGSRPLPLARSLYEHLVTDESWSVRRAQYGYRDMRGVRLMNNLAGHVFIDVRASLTSLVPAALPDAVADRLVRACVSQLARAPHLHDKMEFEVAVTCQAFDVRERLSSLQADGLLSEDAELVEAAAIEITSSMLRRELIASELALLKDLRARDRLVDVDPLQQVMELLEAAKAFGVVPFAGLARCAFVATKILRSAVTKQILSDHDYSAIVSGLRTPSSCLMRDVGHSSTEELVEKYGHLRPGTYDIRVKRYDEVPEYYLDVGRSVDPREVLPLGKAALASLQRGLRRIGLDFGAAEFVEITRDAIEAREWAKFWYSRNVSDALQLLACWGEKHDLSRDQLALLTLADLKCLLERGVSGLGEVLAKRSAQVRRGTQISLPLLIRSAEECQSFESLAGIPNFVTRERVTAPLAWIEDGADPRGAIAIAMRADPGSDWIFARGVVGLVTAYGGVNSHMAVRALDHNIPAAIGCGPARLEDLRRFSAIELDAASKFIRGVA